MSTAKFRNRITTFKRNVYSKTILSSSQHGSRFLRNILPEDQLILDFINNVDFEILYKSKEFKEMLDKRLEIKRLHNLITPKLI